MPAEQTARQFYRIKPAGHRTSSRCSVPRFLFSLVADDFVDELLLKAQPPRARAAAAEAAALKGSVSVQGDNTPNLKKNQVNHGDRRAEVPEFVVADTGGPVAPPHSRQAEEAVLGAVLINPEAYYDIAQFLAVDDFYIHRHRWIWEAFASLHEQHCPIDLLTAADELDRKGLLSEVGGPAYLTTLANQVPTSLNAESYGWIVESHSIRRRMIAAANAIASLAYNESINVDDAKAGSLAAIQGFTQERESKRFILRDAAFALQPQPPIDFIVKDLLTSGSVNVIYGPAGSKKTHAALCLAVCVASGRPWLDFETERSPVLFIDEESGERRFARWLNAAIYGALCQDEEIPLSFVSLAGFRLDEGADPVILQALIKSTGARLVVIDALCDVMHGDENSKEFTQPVFNHLRKIAENTEAAILLIHHSGKAGTYRGSSAIAGAVDLLVQVNSEEGSDFINFESKKSRDSGPQQWAARAHWLDGQFYLEPAARAVGEKPLSKSQQFVLQYLAQHGASELPAIMGAADVCSPGTARNAVYALADLGKIERTNPAELGAPAIYALKSEGEVES